MKKWLIPEPELKLTRKQRATYWEAAHRDQDYEDVYSLSEDPNLQNLTISDLPRLDRKIQILIPGCGSRTSLQESIIKEIPSSHVWCNDFAGVVEIAKTRFSHPRLSYLSGDIKTQNLSSLDAIIHVTSVVSESDQENRAIIDSTAHALAPGGTFLGFFPTVFATLDLAFCLKEEWRMSQLDLRTSSYTEPKQNVTQIFYTPARLRVILLEAGLELDQMQIFFNDSKNLREEAAKHYGFIDPDAVLYHLYVKASKKPNV